MFEDDFFLETLIISPPNLKEMWQGYAHKYQLRAKVISLGEVQNKLKDERRYRLGEIWNTFKQSLDFFVAPSNNQQKSYRNLLQSRRQGWRRCNISC
jgi:hypothetical protein